LADPSTLLTPAATPIGDTVAFGGRGEASDSRARRRPVGFADPSAIRLVAGLGACLVAAEAVTLAAGAAAGVLTEAVILVALAWLSIRQGPGSAQRLTLAVALIPLIRILSIALPAAIVPIVYWYLEIGLAGFEGILLVMRRLELTPRDVGLRRAPVAEVASVAVIGAILGLPAFLIGGRLDLGHGGGLVGLAIASAVVIVFVGFLEEFLFRGLIQSAGTALFSRGGVLLSVGATTLMYSASLNPRYIVFAALVATFFGLVARRSGSIAAPVAGHAALALVQLVVLPIILP
jgi:membrane protease YdiL (CAAX protease family)